MKDDLTHSISPTQLNGKQSPWCAIGWKPFALPLPKCWRPRNLCYPVSMQYSVACRIIKTILKTLLLILSFAMVSLQCTKNWVNITINLMHCHIIHGLQVSSKFFMIYIWTSILLISTWSSYHVWRSWRGFRNRSWPSRPPRNIQRMASGFFQYKLCSSFSPISQSSGLLNFGCLFGLPTKSWLYFKVSKERMCGLQWAWWIFQASVRRFWHMWAS